MADIFEYRDFVIQPDGRTVHYNYELLHNDQLHCLTEKLVFPFELSSSNSTGRGLRALHIALGISYYKMFMPPTIKQPYNMDETEAEFWNDVFRNGLGEFLYVNKLSKDSVAQFKAQDGHKLTAETNLNLEHKAILGIGGGKDSAVAGELLKGINMPMISFVMATGEQLGQSKAVADVMGIDLQAVGRTLDPQLMNLQVLPGAYRGHVPISLIFGLVGVILALQNKAKYVVVANESSASTPTAEWEGNAVNHQWSKSFGFEKSLQNYIKQNIAEDVTYFSAIRPLTSIAVAKKFSNYTKYFEVFTSDNYVFRIDLANRPNGRWSIDSPKSLSSFILLSPWLDEDNLTLIFTQNFLDQPKLKQLFLELIGQDGQPPLDCVGTVDELVLSLNLTHDQGKYSGSALMQLAEERGVIKKDDWQSKLDTSLELQPDQAFPAQLVNELTKGLN